MHWYYTALVTVLPWKNVVTVLFIFAAQVGQSKFERTTLISDRIHAAIYY